MLRIAICCGGGFSSSTLAAHLDKEIKEKHLEDRATFIFIPARELLSRQSEADIAMVCPSMEYCVKEVADEYTIPVSVIPPRLYGLMPAVDFVEDAEDIMELWKAGHKNVVLFDDEPRPLAVKRQVSHRKAIQGKA